MAILHVAVTGRDRRHLSELRNKFRVVVVGARETRGGIVVDAYMPAERVDWLRKKGYGVELPEEIEAPGRARQAEGRAAAETRLKRGRYGDVIWGGGYLTVQMSLVASRLFHEVKILRALSLSLFNRRCRLTRAIGRAAD